MPLANTQYAGLHLGLLLMLSLVMQTAIAEVPDGFVELESLDQSIVVDARYAGTDNFLGVVVDGYQAPRIYMTRAAAQALLQVQQQLQPYGLGVKVFDAYRPQRAVDHFVRWAADIEDTRMQAGFYPRVDKAELFSEGYIAERSGHSRGSAVDLTLVDLASGTELDMGTPWDFFDPMSWPDSDAVNTQQRANRLLLRQLMQQAGFRPLAEEWWHFSLIDEPYPDTYFDFVVE